MTHGLAPLFRSLGGGAVLDEADAQAAFAGILDGKADMLEIAVALTALSVRGAAAAEITGAARAMRARMVKVPAPPHAIDVCGTGGDGRSTLNISTAVAFVLSGCGVPVAKHGNRAVTSRAGAADVLAAMGISAELPPAALGTILDATGIVFLFAPNHHPALRQLAPLRARLGFRTLFNLLGPLCNPAGVRRQVIGVYDASLCARMAEAAGRLGAEHVWVVHGQGTDELTLEGENLAVIWQGGRLSERRFTAADAGLSPAPMSAIEGGDAAHNAMALRDLLQGAAGAYRDTVLLNAAAALIVAGQAATLSEGTLIAANAIDRGLARGAFLALREASLAFSQQSGQA